MKKTYIALALVAAFDSSVVIANQLDWNTESWNLASWQAGGDSDYLDTDGDLLLNIRDDDDDNDGVIDVADLFPLDPTDWADSDNDGLGDNYELSVGLDPNNSDTDNDGIIDGEDPFPLTEEEVKTIRYVMSVDDIDRDNTTDLAVIYEDEDNVVTGVIYNKTDDRRLISFRFAGTYDSYTVHKLADMNGNKSHEIALFGVQLAGGTNAGQKAKLIVIDSFTGAPINTYAWPGNWHNPVFTLLADLTGDGIAEVGMQGEFYIGDRPQLLPKDGATGAALDKFSFPSFMYNPKYVQLSDVNGDGIPEIGLAGRFKSNDKFQVKIVDGTDPSNKFPAYNFGDNWAETKWLSLPDIDFDLTPDFGFYGRRIDSQKIQLFTKSGNEASGTLGIFAWPEDFVEHQPLIIRDVDLDGVNEIGVGGLRTSSDRYQFIVKSGADRSSTVTSLGWPNVYDEPVFHEVGDVDGNGVLDIALTGFKTDTSFYEVFIKDIENAKVAVYRSQHDWEYAPELVALPDINGDGLDDIVLYGRDRVGLSILEVLTIN